MITMRTIRTALALTAATVLAACGSDTILSPTFGSGCNVGSIQAGQTITAAFNDASCFDPYHFYSEDRVPYAGYSVQLTKGKAYLFYEAQVPDPAAAGRNDVDAVLALWGKNAHGASVPLAVSDDQGAGIDGHDSQIWFIAPTSGTYQLVPASYDYSELGGYRLEAHECPVLATLDTAGTYDLTLPASPCVRVAPAGTTTDTTGYAMIAIPADAGETIDVTVTSAAFSPDWEMFGPGFDTYANIYDFTNDDSNTGSGNSTSITMDTVAGVITLAVGSSTTDSIGAFSVTLGRTPAPVAPAGAAPWSLGSLFFTGAKAHPKKTH